MVDDPSAVPEEFPTDEAQENERLRLFALISDLVQWVNTTNEQVLEQARAEIRRSWRRCCADNSDHPEAAELFNPAKLPGFHDPFAGGAALPLEAQRLGLESHASDLNPVAVLINKAMIEIPPKFAGQPPVNPESRRKLDVQQWKGAQGLADDVRYYGQWMRDEAEKRIGHLYPKVEVTAEMAKDRPDLIPYVGQSLTVIAWLWARTVKSPNPAFAQVEVPLVSTFMLSTKAGKEAYVEPIVVNREYRFTVKAGKPKDLKAAMDGTKLARGANFRCLLSGSPIEAKYIRMEAQAGRLGARLMAIVADGNRARVYLPPTSTHEAVAMSAEPPWKPDLKVPTPCHDVDRLPMCGMPTWGDAFTARQLLALTTFSDLVKITRERIQADALEAGRTSETMPLCDGGTGAAAYGDTVGVFLGLTVSKETIFLVTLARWRASEGKSAPAFGRQAISMVWDYADINPFAGAGGDFLGIIDGAVKSILNSPPPTSSSSQQSDAGGQTISTGRIVSTDPPYYDNIGYADLSDYFYV